MRHGSLFSGIGGFDLAAEWMGWTNVFHCEWMPFPQKVLKHYWPNAISYHDITKTDFTIHRGDIDILSGGFPCQPYSAAGKRLGKDDERHLWPEMLRAIKEIAPTWVVGENVYGLTNWNGGVVFEEVCADLEDCGYEVQPVLLPACAKDAPHRRDRIWFIAQNTKCDGCLQRKSIQEGTDIRQQRNFSTGSGNRIYLSERIAPDTDGSRNREGMRIDAQLEEKNKEWKGQPFSKHRQDGYNGNAPDTDGDGLKECNGGGIDALNDLEQDDGKEYFTDTNGIRLWRKSNRIRRSEFICENGPTNNWLHFPTQSPICGGNDGLPTKLDGITFPKWRAESIKGYGNAVVPQVVFEIFKVIEKINNNK